MTANVFVDAFRKNLRGSLHASITNLILDRKFAKCRAKTPARSQPMINATRI